MSTTLITSAISVLAIAVASLATFFNILRSDNKSREDVAFSFCWLSAGFVFLMISLRIVFFSFGFMEVVRILAYINQVVLFSLFITFGYYVFYVEIKNYFIKNFLFILVLVSGLFFLFYLFQDGIVGPIISDWGIEYTSPASSNSFLIFAGGISIISLISFFIKQIYFYFRKTNFDIKRLLSYLSLLIFLLAGIFEQLGNANWLVLFFRIVILVSALLAFYIYFFKEEFN